jgi:hypothetical protein
MGLLLDAGAAADAVDKVTPPHQSVGQVAVAQD